MPKRTLASSPYAHHSILGLHIASGELACSREPVDHRRLRHTGKQMTKTPAADVDLCVVVVNYCTPEMLIDCLETLVPQVRRLNATITLVDNASPDDSVMQLSAGFPISGANDCVQAHRIERERRLCCWQQHRDPKL